jgi:hypothetical protein
MLRKILLSSVCAALLIAVFAGYTKGRAAADRTVPLKRQDLCVTEGTIDELPGDRLSVTVPKMRAYATVPTLQDVTAHFTYLGPTQSEAPVGSGEMRRQLGLQLHAEDACNLIYAMWRIEPESELVVSVKSDPGQHTSAECANRGYHNSKPRRSSPVPGLRPGVAHTLHAEMRGEDLRVFVDNNLVWDGSVGSEAAAFSGPVGMRSDNAHLEIALEAGWSGGARPAYQMACRQGETE